MQELALHDPRQLFLRREALARGYSDNDLRDALREHQINRIRHGAYTAASIWSAADQTERYRLRCQAVLATHETPVALSHTSAVVMHGTAVWPANLQKVHLTKLDGRTERIARDIVYHRGRVREDDLAALPAGGLIVGPARACIEHSSLVGVESGLVTLDSFLASHGEQGLTNLHQARDEMAGWPGVRRLHVTLRLARTGSESVGETRLRYLCWERHLPEPILQYVVTDGSGVAIARTDFAWPEKHVIGEFDGRVKYERFLRPGESPADALFREKVREDRIRELTGFAVVRFTWPDLDQRDQTAARLRQVLGVR